MGAPWSLGDDGLGGNVLETWVMSALVLVAWSLGAGTVWKWVVAAWRLLGVGG